MALRITRKPTDYVSETAYVYDVAKTSKYFDKSVYEGLSALGDQDAIKQYLYGLAEAKDKTASAFNQYDYANLESPEDQASYVLYTLSNKKDAELDKYFEYKIQESVDKKTFNSLNAFEKTMSSIGGIVGNALNETLFGTIEGLIDLGAVIVRQKDWAAKDFTGVAENRENIQRFTRAYSYIDKEKGWKIANDVATGIAQMLPMLIPVVGKGVYFGGMSGNTASDAIRTNPNIDYASLLLYTGAVTVVEYGTEALSAKLFGGAGNFIDSKLFGKTATKGTTKLGELAAKSWVYDIGLNFISEGLEESIAEFADTALFNIFIAQGNDDLRKSYSMQDVLYAGLIGGLIGGLMEGASLATTQKYSLTEDGRLVQTKTAKKQGLKTETDFSKIQTRSLLDKLGQAKHLLESDAVLDLMTKYPKIKSREQLQQEHPKAYAKALAKNKQIQNDAIGVVLGLNKIFEMVGAEGFSRAADLANGTFEQRRTLLQNYVDAIEGRTRKNVLDVEDKINKALSKEYGSNVIFSRTRTGLTPAQIRLANNLKNKYGINVHYGTFGTADGSNYKFDLTTNEKRYGATISATDIVLDTRQFGEMSEQEILDKVIKEELVHTVQFTNGVITPVTLFAIYRATGNMHILPSPLNKAYEGDTKLSKLSEAQAKAVAQVLLFDDVTVDKMFKSNYDTFGKLYRFFNKLKNFIENSRELRSQKGKAKYNQLLKSMKMYRDIASKYLGTEANVKQFIKDFEIIEPQYKEILQNAYLPNETVEPIDNWVEAVFAKEVDETPQDETGEKTEDKKKRTINPKKIKEAAKISNEDTAIFEYLNEYLANEKQLIISQQNNNFHVYSRRGRPGKPKYTFDNVQDMLDTLYKDEYVSEDMYNKMKAITADTIPENELLVETKAGQEILLYRADVKTEIRSVKPDNAASSSLAYVQLDIFDNIDPNMTEESRTKLLNQAITQENKMLKERHTIPEDRLATKVNELLKLFDNRDLSEFQGDVDDPEVERISNELFAEHPEAFLDIESKEFVALKDYAVVRIGEGPEYGALTNTLIRYAWLNRADQFKDIQQLVETLYSEWIATGAQAIGLTSSDYETTISHFMKQMALERGVFEIKLPSDLFVKLIPDFKLSPELETKIENDMQNNNQDLKKSKADKIIAAYVTSLDLEITDLTKQLKKTEDPLDKRDLRNQIYNKKIIKAALSADDIGKAIDYHLKTKFEEGVNISDTIQMRNDIYEAIVAHLIKNAEIKGDSVVGISSKKIPDTKAMEKAKKFFMGVESFRYLMMLSNPLTGIKNGAVNVLFTVESFVEDSILKTYEKSSWLLPQAAQAKFTGDYDNNFKNYVKELSWDKIIDDCEGDKYTTEEFKKLQRKYAEAKDPIKKSKALSLLQKYEHKLLSDKWAVSRRTLRNFTQTLAGSSDLILKYSIDYLKTKYFKQKELLELQRSDVSIEDRQKALIDKINKTNKPVAELLTQAVNGDKIAILKIANVANLDIVKPDLKIKNSIYYKAFERANKTFLKTDNYITEMLSKIKKSHPSAAWAISHLIPFARVATNSLIYVLDRSPIGFAKGVHDMFKTRRQWTFEMREAIDGYYKQKYIAEQTSVNKDKSVDMNKYKTWFDSLDDHDGISANKLHRAMNNDDKAAREIFEQMVELGWVSREQIGSNNIFARADVAEKLAQGTFGSAMLVLGLILGSVLDFDYDEDDYLGPILKYKNYKIQLNSISPFSTLISMPAMLKSDVADKYEKIFEIFADATILSTFDSALSYSDSLWDYIKNQSINIATQYQPAFTKAIAKVWHNKKKDKGSLYGKRLLNSLMANTIVFNSLVPNKINPYTGEPEKYYDAGVWEGLFNMILPVGFRVTSNSAFEREAIRLKAESDGFSGSFTINETDIKLTGKDKQKYATHKARYIHDRFNNIYNGREKVTVKDEKTGKFKTVTYDKLTDEEKQKVLKNLYTTGTTVTKIQYWLDKGNSYIVTDRDQYYDYKKLFGDSAKIVFKNKWSTSKFVEG